MHTESINLSLTDYFRLQELSPFVDIQLRNLKLVSPKIVYIFGFSKINEYHEKGGLNAIMEISSLSVQIVLCVCVSGACYQPPTTDTLTVSKLQSILLPQNCVTSFLFLPYSNMQRNTWKIPLMRQVFSEWSDVSTSTKLAFHMTSYYNILFRQVHWAA